MGNGFITSASGLLFLFVIMYMTYNSPTMDFGSIEWFYKSMITTITILLALILVALGSILSRLVKE